MVFVSAGFRQSYGLFIPSWIDEFEVSVSTISFVSAGGWVVNGIAQPIVGRMSDQYGARVVMVWSVVVLGISTLGMALATGIWVLAFFCSFDKVSENFTEPFGGFFSLFCLVI